MYHKILQCFIFSLISVISNSQDILFFEDFNGCKFPDSWSYSINGFQKVAWGVGLPANPKAESLSINGSCMLYVDDDLTGDKTPGYKIRFSSGYFNSHGYTDVFFNAQVHFRKDKTESMRIIIDNGIREHIIREFKGVNYNGNKFNEFLDMKSDLSFITTDSMRIIIEYEDDGIWGWWAGIDNIKVTGTKGGKIVLGETFNDCRLPSDWKTEIVSGVDNWNFGIFKDGKSIDGTCFAYFNDDALGKDAPLSKIRLYSPEFDGSVFANYLLTYDLIFRIYEPSEYLQLYIDNGKEWIPVKTYNGDFGGPNVNQSKKDTINLSAFRSQKIRLIWEYNDGGWAWWLGFDNIKIIGFGDINDRCTKAIPLDISADCLTFDNTNALAEDELGLTDSVRSGILYYAFSPSLTETYKIFTKSSFNDQLEIYSGNCTDLTLISKKDKDEYGFAGEAAYIEAIAGNNYVIRVLGRKAEFGLDRGPGCISLIKASKPEPPTVSELCTIATPIQANRDCIRSNNTNTSLDGPLPKSNPRSRADIWFSFTPEETGDFEFFSNADFADVIAIYAGSCDSLTELKSDFNGQKITINVTKTGQTYFIQVTGYFAVIEGQVCAEIKTKTNTPIPNPVCQTANSVLINAGCVTSNNIGAGYSGIRPSCDVYIKDDVWFSFTAPATAEVFIKAKTSFENIISVYSGRCTSLKPFYCRKSVHHCNGFIRLERLIPGQVYYIQVGSILTNDRYNAGEICLEIYDHQPEWQKVDLEVTQECVSKGAVLFTPSATGGNGLITFSGLGLDQPVPGNDQYIIEAKDSDGCIDFALVEAASCNNFGCTLVSIIEKSNVSCYNAADGRASVVIHGGLEPYHVKWSNGMDGTNITGLIAGNYTVTVSDISGCELTETIALAQPAQITPNPTYQSPLCAYDSTGAISLLTTGGSGAYDYQWADGSKDSNLQHIPEGIYLLTITDSEGCISVHNFELTAPQEISISANIKYNLCHGDNTGKISAEIKGGTGSLTTVWSHGSNGVIADSLVAGIYNLTVTDKNNCIAVKNWELTDPQPIIVTEDIVDLIFSSTKNAEIKVIVTGGTPPYFFEWYVDGISANWPSQYIFPASGGTYSVVITDSNGCLIKTKTWEVSRSTYVEENISDVVKIYPNPVRDYLNLSYTSSERVHNIKITDIYGNECNNITLEQNKENILKINVMQLHSGCYFLMFNIGNDKKILKVIKAD